MSSDLRILLFGFDDDITKVGNALLGSKGFIEKKKVTQSYNVRLQVRRNLHVTAPMGGQFAHRPDGSWCLKDEFVTRINSTDCHAVVLTMEVNAYLDMMGNFVWNVARQNGCLKDLISKKGVIVIREADTFKQAQKDGTISVTFSKWMAQQDGEVGELFHLVQGRCLLLDTSRNSQNVLITQRNEMIDMIDERVLGWKYFTGLWFMENEQKSTQIEQRLSDLNQRITTTTSELENREKTNFVRVEEMAHLLNVSIKEIRQQLDTFSLEATKKSEDTERKLLGLQVNLQNETTERDLSLNKMRESSVATDKKLSELQKNLQKENAERTLALNEVKERSGDTKILLSDLQRKVREREKDDQVIQQQYQTHSNEITKLSEEVAVLRGKLMHVQKSSIWEQIKSFYQYVPNLISSWKISLLLLVVLAPLPLFLTPLPLSGPFGVAHLDESQDLHSYMDAKFEHMTKMFQAMEKQLTDNKILGQMVKKKLLEKYKTDSVITDQESQSLGKLFTELNEQLVNDRSEKMESISKTIPRSLIIWGMIQSLPMSLPLVLSWILLILLIVPLGLSIPRGYLLVSLLILQLIFLLLLLSM